jgi:hypothetical protein
MSAASEFLQLHRKFCLKQKHMEGKAQSKESENKFKTKATATWDIAVCDLLQVYLRFRGTYRLHHQGALCHKNLKFQILNVSPLNTRKTSACELFSRTA